MPQILTIAHQKGGVGKSTISLNLAYVFQHGLKVGVLDTDLQGSIAETIQHENGIELILPYTPLNEFKELPYEVIIIDTPPYLSSRLPELFQISDLILVPTKAGFFDAMAIRSTLRLIQEAKAINPALQAGIVFSMVKSRSSITDEVKSVMTHNGIPLLSSIITDRVCYTRSILTGGVLRSKDEKAKREMLTLADELLNLIGL